MKRTRKIKKIIIAIMTSVWTVFSVFSSTLPSKAATAGSGTAVSGSTTVCSYSWTFVNNGIVDIGTNLGIVKSSMHVDIDMTAYYSGALTITLSGTSSFANIGIFVKGGYLATTSTNQCKIQLIANVSHVEVDFISSIEFTTVPNWTVTVSASGINKIDDLEHTSLDNIDDYTGRISAAVTSSTNGLPAIYNSLDSIDDALTVLQDSITYLSQSVNFERIQTFPIWQQNVLFWANSMGELQFDRQMPYFYYNAGDNTGAAANPKRLKISKNKTTSLIFYSSANISTANINIYGSHASDITLTGLVSTVVPTYPLYLYKFDFKNNYNGSNFPSIEFTVSQDIYPLFLGDSELIPEDVCILMGIEYNNTYTRLLQGIINAVGTISQQQIVENNTNITNYNDYQTQIHNVENNYYTEYNTYEQSIENTNAFDFTGLSNDGINQYHNLFNNVYSISLVRWPLLITLLGLVLVFILG